MMEITDDQLVNSFAMPPWEHQLRTVRKVFDKFDEGVAALTLCLPTGAGKTNCATSVLNIVQAHDQTACLLSNRKMLTEQLSDALYKFGIPHGVRAASLPGRIDHSAPIQIASIQTELARSVRSDKWERKKYDWLIIDEAHNQVNGESLAFIQRAIAEGTKVILMTGTPLGMSHVTPHLIVGATNSELRKCGAHVPAIIKCINEFDTSKVVRKKVGVDAGEFTESSAKAWFSRHQQQIVGAVRKDWKMFNPEERMTLGVAPGSEEAITLAEEFWKHGIPSAAVTSLGIFANGELHKDDPEGKIRKRVDDAWQAGEIKVMWNRFVYREAIDRPGIYHLILATPIGSLKSFLQTCGRAIRKSPSTPDHVIIQDHSGCWFEHGSPNEDRDWAEMYTMTEAEIREKRKKKNKSDADKGEEPVCCLKCGTVLSMANVHHHQEAVENHCQSPTLTACARSFRKAASCTK